MKDSISLKNGTKFDDLDEEWKRDKGEKMEDKKENQLMNNVFTKTGLNR